MCHTFISPLYQGEKMSTGILAPTTIVLGIPGTLTTDSRVAVTLPFSGRITGASVAVNGAPAGSALTAALKVGAAVAANFSIPAGDFSDAGTLGDGVDFTSTDWINLDILTIGSGTAGSNITVAFTVIQN
jgi:hypothetical protein